MRAKFHKERRAKYKNQTDRVEGVGPERFRAAGAVSAQKEIRWPADWLRGE
jgi:hypothetical protein